MIKIIDILNKMADGTLQDGFKFKYYGELYTYDKEDNRNYDERGCTLSDVFVIENCLVQAVNKINERINEDD